MDSKVQTLEYGLFVAAPMAGFQDDALFERNRKAVLAMIDRIRYQASVSRIYYAGKVIGARSSFTPSGDALEQDLGALNASKRLLLVYPRKIATGALVELGYALALRLPTIILVRDYNDLPYFLRHIRGRFESSLTGSLVVSSYADDADLGLHAVDALQRLG